MDPVIPPHVAWWFDELTERGLLGPRAREILGECIGWTPDDLDHIDRELGGEA